MPFDEKQLKTWLVKTTGKQSSIEKVANWCIHYRKYYKQICETWFNTFRDTPEPNQRLIMIYIINHTIQESKKKSARLPDMFALNLEEMFGVFGLEKLDEKIVQKVLHVFEIWKSRRVLSPVKIKKMQSKFLGAREQQSSSKKRKSGSLSRKDDAKKSKKERKKAKKEKEKEFDEALLTGTAQRKRLQSQAIFQAAMQQNSIYSELDWLDGCDQEIYNFNDNYLDRVKIENQTIPGMGLQNINAKDLSDRMMELLRAPSSLESDTRTALTKLPDKLADPSKLDLIIDNGQTEIESTRAGPERYEKKKALKAELLNTQTEAENFKNVLEEYNKRLLLELDERRQLGDLHILVELERKKTHVSHLEKLKQIVEREEKSKINMERLEEHYEHVKSPKLPEMDDDDDDDLLPDIKDLMEGKHLENKIMTTPPRMLRPQDREFPGKSKKRKN